MKWLWKYVNDKQLLWGKVIKAKYERENRWMTKEVISPYGVCVCVLFFFHKITTYKGVEIYMVWIYGDL